MSRLGSWAKKPKTIVTSPGPAGVLVTALVVLGLSEVIARAALGRLEGESLLALLLLAVGSTLPLAVLGIASSACAICATCILSLEGFHLLTVASAFALLLSLFRLGSEHRRQLQLLAVALAVPFFILTLSAKSPLSSESAALTLLLGTLAPISAIGGVAFEARREANENRAARLVIADTLIESTARSERARIARELHDVVAHHISMVAVQAESARLAVRDLPAAGAERLSEIGDTARAALVEMRQLLGVLREDARVNGPERHPQPGISQVTDLVDEARKVSKSATRLILSGTPIPLDPSVELVAYRLIQEALSNARRHAPGAAVDVELTYADAELRLRVRDNGPGTNQTALPAGHGLNGMDERATAVGGAVRTGPSVKGGYVVEAILPAKIEEHA